MKDSDPRPMPPEVQRAYRDPLNLKELLASTAFTDRDRLAVRDELLDRLTKKRGNVEVEVGKSAKIVPIRRRVSQFRKNFWGSIEVMIAAEELGGREAVMLELASVMQPYWLRWWERRSWRNYYWDTEYDTMTSCTVMGTRQIAWIAAQYARSVIDLTLLRSRQEALNAVLAAESWAIAPSEENLRRATMTAGFTNKSEVEYEPASWSAACAASAASYSVYETGRPSAKKAARAADFAANARVSSVVASARSSDTERYASEMGFLCELSKRLITPTLITSASRGLR